jgi:GT2 family glycosyltransferase/SAM-dependent methyltransferase
MKNKSKKISIIIVSYKDINWLKRIIDDLCKQTFNQLEIIVVANGTTNNKIYQQLQYDYQNVIFIFSKKNLGFSGANNLGISSSSGEYILLINPDTRIEKNFLETLFDEMLVRKLDVIAPIEANYYTKIPTYYQTKIDVFGHPVFKVVDTHTLPEQNFFLPGHCILFSKKLYEKTGGMDDNIFMYFEELDWFWRLFQQKRKIGYSEKVFVYHKGAITTSSGISDRKFLWRNQNTLKVLIKNYDLVSLIIVLPIVFTSYFFESMIFFLFGKPQIGRSYISAMLVMKECIALYKKNKIKSNLLNMITSRSTYLGFGKLHHLKEYIKGRKKRILEIGCGNGFHANTINNKLNEVIGIDLSKESISVAKNRYPNTEFRVMNAENLKFKDNSFNEIYALDVLEHVDNLKKVMEEISRVLCPGGYLKINVPDPRSEKWLIKLRPTYFKEIHHVRVFSYSDLEKLQKYGFEITTYRRHGFLQHIELYFLFKSNGSESQLSISDWRANNFLTIIHLTLLFFNPIVLMTPLKYIPLWIITLPIGIVIDYVGSIFFPKSQYCIYKKTEEL